VSPGRIRCARQAAAGLNYIDIYHRTGYYSQPLPFIPRLEGAGTVEAIGQDVRGLKIADRVAYAGRYSEVRLMRINANQRFALRDAADAHKALEARAISGTTILTI
jgi:NADPH2:quinone reductase